MTDTEQRVWQSSDELVALDRTTTGEYRLRVDRGGTVAVSDKLPEAEVYDLYIALGHEVGGQPPAPAVA